jgi:hypothetical protein
LLVLSTSPAFAETVVLDAVARGQPGCFPFLGCPGLAPDASYAVGATGLGYPGPSVHRNAFAFELSPVSAPIVGATLVLVNPPGGFSSPHRRERYAVYGVSLPADQAGSALMFQDVGAGALLGSIEVDANSPSVLEIPLATPILRVLERTDGLVVLGGLLTTLAFKGGPERLFEGTGPGSGVAPPRLVLTTDPAATPAAAAVLAVDGSEGDDAGDGSVASPLLTLSAALDLAAPGDIVEVAPGRYSERVLLREGVTLRGSGPGATTLDLAELPVANRAVVCAEDAVLEGFRISDQSGDFGSLLVECGASTEIAHNVFESAADSIRQSGGSAWIHDNRIVGAVSIQSPSGVVEDNEIEAAGGGADAVGIGSDEVGAVLIRRNRIRGLLRAGGEGTSLTIASNLFLSAPASEVATLDGALIGELASALVLHNTFHDTDGVRVLYQGTATIASNLLVAGTSGVLVGDQASAVVRNNDAFGNRAGIMGAATNYVGIDDPDAGGNISSDPEFVDAFFEDFRLRPTSPARDAGSDEPEDVAGDEDLDGDPRVVDVLDMGAQEFQPSEELPLPPLAIAVDVLPGRSPNELKFAKVQKGSGKLAVAILSDDEFDAPADVNLGTLILERERALRCSDKDVDRDGRRDLLCSFPLRGISVENWPIFVPPACVRGERHDGRKLLGCDEVEIPL